MCRHAVFVVPPEPGSVPSARGFCRQTLTGWGLVPMIGDAQLVLSELVTNGVLHAGTPLGVTVSGETGHLEIAVSDGSTSVPKIRPRRQDLTADLDALIAAGPVAETTSDRDPRLDVGEAGSVVGGRGLELVACLAVDWGVDVARSGKSVWARLPTPADWPPGADCHCAGGTGGVRLSSGRAVSDTAPHS